MRIIGDVHGHYSRYRNKVRKMSSSVQLGDFGFVYTSLNGLNPDLHKIIGGNHDNYDLIYQVPHYLGDFGRTIVDGIDFFFIRGEKSIDQKGRIEFPQNHLGHSVLDKKNWWKEEELGMVECYAALELFEKEKPDLVMSHGCPLSIVPFFANENLANQIQGSSRTAQILQAMFEVHQPSLWIFGHYHQTKSLVAGKTKFQCLAELDTMEL